MESTVRSQLTFSHRISCALLDVSFALSTRVARTRPASCCKPRMLSAYTCRILPIFSHPRSAISKRECLTCLALIPKALLYWYDTLLQYAAHRDSPPNSNLGIFICSY